VSDYAAFNFPAAAQSCLFDASVEPVTVPRRYGPWLTVALNAKGVLEVDTVKGCSDGMAMYPNGGCYGECYAARNAKRYGIDFSVSVNRNLHTPWHKSTLCLLMAKTRLTWFRVGTFGDPSYDWRHSISMLRALWPMEMTPVIVTKLWRSPTDVQIEWLRRLGAVVNVSVSALDSDAELSHRLQERTRLANGAIRSVLRVVTCRFGQSSWARAAARRQGELLSMEPVIDNPLRPSPGNPLVIQGDILTETRNESVGGGKGVSLHLGGAYLGRCDACPDQCGVEGGLMARTKAVKKQLLWEDELEYRYVPQIIGSGFEAQVAELALEDGIAHRAARKNMQIHSAIVLVSNGEFAGFFTFQNNHETQEFCLLQSVIRPDQYTAERYRDMALAVLAQNTSNFPAIITTDPKSKFETPAFFESIGFQTYLKQSGFCYMATGDLARVRRKLLAHLTMVNYWRTTTAEWLRVKREWNTRINAAGERHGIAHPEYATREGCWQGESGFANVVTGHHHNHNASVLDPVVCEIVAQLFGPAGRMRVYNPFGGGVQMGFVAGWLGHEYLASEIRQNQCDANNAICSDLADVHWVCTDSASYQPSGDFDLVFACPPYYRVEKYLDYDGQSPTGEINALSTYEQFRDCLFAGYRIAIDHLREDRFIVIMTGDSRDGHGGYRCSEAETELFLRDVGLVVYNRIVYLEGEFTRLAQAKKTLQFRKFPKAEQKIIVAYKGDTGHIKDVFPPIGRL
jgi:hypothetical protein